MVKTKVMSHLRRHLGSHHQSVGEVNRKRNPRLHNHNMVTYFPTSPYHLAFAALEVNIYFFGNVIFYFSITTYVISVKDVQSFIFFVKKNPTFLRV